MVFNPRPEKRVGSTKQLSSAPTVEVAPQKGGAEEKQASSELTSHPFIEEFEVVVDESLGVTSRGYLVHTDDEGPLIVFFGGNATDNRHAIRYFSKVRYSSIITNYRGYGRSDGEPSEKAILEDAKKLVAWAKQSFPARYLILMGYSMGTGVATITAASDSDVKGLILLSPYRSLVHVAQSNFIYRLLPLNMLMRHKFDSIDELKNRPDKVLIVYSISDWTIPTSESRAFVSLVPQAETREFQLRHNQIMTDDQVWSDIQSWLEKEFVL